MLRNLVLTLLVLTFAGPASAAEWKMQKGPLVTRWAKEVSPAKVLPEYPRPQMVRKEWVNLNGLWQYAVRPKAEAKAEKWDGEILVPFAIESALSGVMKTVKNDERLWYRRTFAARDAEGWAAAVALWGGRLGSDGLREWQGGRQPSRRVYAVFV